MSSNTSPKKVAILGGGIAGLSCASQLLSRHKQSGGGQSYELEVTVFDTGRLRPGGRCSSRLVGDKPPVVKNSQPQQRRACDDDALQTNNQDETNITPINIHKALLANTNHQQGNNNSMARILNSAGAIDHAAQIISVPKLNNGSSGGGMDRFQSQVDEWLTSNVLEKFPEGSVCELINDDGAADEESANKQLKLEPLKGDMYYGKGGMGNIPLAMLDYCLSFNGFGENYTGQSFRIAQDVWVSPSNGVKYIGNRNKDDDNNNNDDDGEPQWELRAGNKSLGKYHNLVIAHNGKCADRIMSRTPAKAFHSLLRTKFAPYVPQWGGREMTLNSIYSLVFAIKSSDGEASPISKVVANLCNQNDNDDDDDVYTIMIKNEPTLRLLSCNSLKHHHAQNPNSQSNIEIYTLLSSPKFGKQFKGPQENLPLDLQEKVVMKLLSNLEHSLNLDVGDVSNSVVDLKLQVWGAAVPMNTWSSTSSSNNGDVDGFVYDATYGVGAAGDWILDPSVAGAWESGRRLADWMLQHHEESDNKREKWSVGLPDLTNNSNNKEKNGKFVPSRVALESGIGTIPPSPNSKFEFPSSSSNDGQSQRGQGGGRGRGGGGRGRGRGGRGGRSGRGGGGGRNSNRARNNNDRMSAVGN